MQKKGMTARNLVCIGIDRYESGCFCGRIWHQYADEAILFGDIMEMLRMLDSLYDKWNFPQSATRSRTFAGTDAPSVGKNLRKAGTQMEVHSLQGKSGEKATFIVRVKYRQNSTWQGDVVWAEQEQKRSFRSALELLKMIDSALDKETENAGTQKMKEGGWN